MTEGRAQRRLAAILAVDVVGYSRMVGIAAEEILAKWNGQFGADAQSWNDLDPKKLRNWLCGFEGTSRLAIAAPGLSLHGQARAIEAEWNDHSRYRLEANRERLASHEVGRQAQGKHIGCRSFLPRPAHFP